MAQSEMNSVFPLLQTALGGVLAIGGGIVAEWYKRRRDERSLALAFRGEIHALRAIVRQRKYVELLRDALVESDSGAALQRYSVRVTKEYLTVYNKNVDKIGTLPGRLPELLAEFYTYANSALEDMNLLSDPSVQISSAELAAHYRDLLEVLSRAFQLADEIENLIADRYS